MRFLALILLALCIATPAKAVNELQGHSLQEVMDITKAHGATAEKLSEADAATLDKVLGPRPVPNADLYVLRLNDSAIIMLVVDATVVFSSAVVPASALDKVLERTGA